MTQHYRVKDTAGNREQGLKVGSTVQAFTGADAGMKADHESFTSKPHVNITPDGLEPFFCVPAADLEPLDA